VKVGDRIRLADSFGFAVVNVRKAHGFSREDLADLLALEAKDIRAIELSLELGAPHFVDQMANVLGLADDDRGALKEKRKRELLRDISGEGCASCAAGELAVMHAGPGDRFDNCAHVSRCLERVVRAFPAAKQAHCPAQCSARRDVSREERRTEANLQGKDSHDFPRWGTKERKRHVPISNHRRPIRTRVRAT
jgi:transcriptional regulator with XRE-family HTH domain